MHACPSTYEIPHSYPSNTVLDGVEVAYQLQQLLTQDYFDPGIQNDPVYAIEDFHVKCGATTPSSDSSKLDTRSRNALRQRQEICSEANTNNRNSPAGITREDFHVKSRLINQALDSSCPSHFVGSDYEKLGLHGNSPVTNMLTEFPSYLPPAMNDFGFLPPSSAHYASSPSDLTGNVSQDPGSISYWDMSERNFAQRGSTEYSTKIGDELSPKYAYGPQGQSLDSEIRFPCPVNTGPFHYHDPRQETMMMVASEPYNSGPQWSAPEAGLYVQPASTYSPSFNGSYVSNIPAHEYVSPHTPAQTAKKPAESVLDVPLYSSQTPSLESCHSHTSSSNPNTPICALTPIDLPRDHERLSQWFSDQSQSESLPGTLIPLHHQSPSTTDILRFESGPTMTSPSRTTQQQEALSSIRHNPLYRKKVLLACYFCRRRKMACTPSENGDSSCAQCLKKDVECEYPKESRRGQHRRKLKKE
ncbi:hypothetical protein AAF712_012642 [Marasmius tenuissimus]|uniref:Zn(2)-C6 fungal-type domain-containing protein n=1 Tax=Marasmius tenuissimus TaxID=585030 RepID=A0ABR2ZI14_9AGAR